MQPEAMQLVLRLPLSFVVVVSLFAPRPAFAERQEPKQLGQVLANLHVVEGVIASIKHLPQYSDDDGIISEVQLDVWRVYCGDGITENSKFMAYMGQGKPYMRAADAYNLNIPLLDWKAGNHRIWLVEWGPDQGKYIGQPHSGTWLFDVSMGNMTDAEFLFPFLGHERGDEAEKLEAAPRVAAALYSLVKAKDDADRVRLLETQVRGSDPFIAVTDCWLLYQADGTPERARVATELFLDPRVPIAARTCLDGLIRQCNSPNPKPTPERDKAFVDMAVAARTKSDFFSLGIALRRGAGCDLSAGECLEVTRTALRNQHFLSTCDESTTIGFVAFTGSIKSAEDRDKLFEFFAALIGGRTDARFEVAAAIAIDSVGPLAPRQLGRLLKIEAECRSELAAGYINQAILACKK